MYASQKARKLGIVSSIVAIVVCIVLITGSTFSLFTGSTDSDITISAGQITLNADIENLALSSLGVNMAGTTFANGGSAALNDAKLDLTNVTPGDRVEFDIVVYNTSSVSISYAITWKIEGALKDYLKVTVDNAAFENGTSDWNEWLVENKATDVVRKVAIELPKGTNNDAMGLSASIAFDLAAVQYNAVDETVESADQLELAIENFEAAKLEGNIVVPAGEKIEIPEDKEFTLDLNGYTITSENGESPIVNDGKLVIIGGTSTFARTRSAAAEKASGIITANGASAIVNNGEAHIEGVTILGNIAKDVAPVILNNGEMTIVNATIENTAINGDSAIKNTGNMIMLNANVIGSAMGETGYPAYAVANTGKLEITGSNVTSDRGCINNSGKAELVINSGSLVVSNAADGRNMTLHTIYGYGSSTVTIYDGNFEMNHTSTSGASVICPAGATINIYGGNFRDAMDDSTWTSTGNFQNYMGYSARPYVYGGSFDDDTVKKWIADGYTVSTLNGINYVVKSGDKVVEGANGESITVPEEVEDVIVGTEEKTVQQAINEAAKAGTSIYIAEAGTYTVPEVGGKTFTIAGSKDVIVERGQGSLAGSAITFNGVSINCSDNGYIGFYDIAEENYVNCTITGQPFLYADKVTFTGCTFNQAGIGQYNVWTYAAKNVTFDGCVFNCADRSVLIYSEGGATADGPQTVTFNGCKFNSETAADGKAAIEIGTSAEHNTVNVIINDCTVNGFAAGSVSENNLYNPKNGDKHNIVLDGVTIIDTGLGKIAETNAYYVYNETGFMKMHDILAACKAGRNAMINIMADLDMTDRAWSTVDSHVDANSSIIGINGNGHTISNLTINGQAMFSRFSGIGDVEIKDLTFDGATVNTTGINASILCVQTYQNVLLDNVDIKNSSITGAYKVAPYIGSVYNENPSSITATLKNCDVSNTTVTATYLDFCTTGMVAFVYAGNNDKIEFENCTVTNVAISAPNAYSAHAWVYTTGSETLFNEVEGVTVSGCTFENI